MEGFNEREFIKQVKKVKGVKFCSKKNDEIAIACSYFGIRFRHSGMVCSNQMIKLLCELWGITEIAKDFSLVSQYDTVIIEDDNGLSNLFGKEKEITLVNTDLLQEINGGVLAHILICGGEYKAINADYLKSIDLAYVRHSFVRDSGIYTFEYKDFDFTVAGLRVTTSPYLKTMEGEVKNGNCD